MSAIGIIANPMSGKDIRRLVSHATVIDNNEKINIIERVVIGAQKMGVDTIVLMPESHNMAYRAVNLLIQNGELDCEVEVQDFYIYGTVEDTMKAARLMEEDERIGCIVSLGGDGTNRAIAKEIVHTPMISLSTGTNNVYPDWVEGTAAGIAAGLTATKACDCKDFIVRQKRIEITKNGVPTDIALIDAVLSNDPVIGSKAIWNTKSILGVVVSRCHPATIGFSAIAGVRKIITNRDRYGGVVFLGKGYDEVLAPVAPGTLESIGVSPMTTLHLGQPYRWEATQRGTIALDGEREIYVKPHDILHFTVTDAGPLKVHVRETIEQAQKEGKFKLTEGKRN